MEIFLIFQTIDLCWPLWCKQISVVPCLFNVYSKDTKSCFIEVTLTGGRTGLPQILNKQLIKHKYFFLLSQGISMFIFPSLSKLEQPLCSWQSKMRTENVHPPCVVTDYQEALQLMLLMSKEAKGLWCKWEKDSFLSA